jgi:hypothetical protein
MFILIQLNLDFFESQTLSQPLNDAAVAANHNNTPLSQLLNMSQVSSQQSVPG